jgi:pilus assembly protein CpaD
MERNLMQRPFSRYTFLAGLGLAVVSLALVPKDVDAKPRGTFNRGMQSERQPVVSYTNFAYDVQVGSGGGLSPSEAQRLDGWLASIDIAYADRVMVSAADSAYGSAITDDIADLVARRGLPIEEDVSPSSQQGLVRITVRRPSASVPGCPDWSDKPETNGMGSTSRNYGCGVNGNLAAMIANPEDLVRGRTGTSDLRGATSNRAIQVYRDKVPTGSGDLKTLAGGN